ncbi:Prefoldin subunit-domain-containing protein [Papiliotrema laurentii]|uniref:Prefoldin subunit 4 n=1 Tax=Papiliotrema laurentii TaxID=5418 RepID=A0AAD9D321_PAPLA|nr:Prefoldin subunit-domain-containing protein [Papiliotrema laurentii]
MSLLPPEDEDADGIEVAWEDQQRINTFSKLNIRLSEIQDQLKVKQEEKDYYDDLETELELADEDEPVLYKMGEAFFYLSLPAAKKQLRHDTKRYEKDIGELRERAEECEKGMKELKVQLYAKFGKQINLETTLE